MKNDFQIKNKLKIKLKVKDAQSERVPWYRRGRSD